MLAANIDDMTGEAFGYLMERLMAEGALDVSFVPLTMKKSRPGLMAQVVARVEDEEKLGNLLLNECRSAALKGFRPNTARSQSRLQRAPAVPARNTNRRRRWRARTMCLIWTFTMQR